MTYGVYTLKQHPPLTVSSISSFINPDSSLQRKHWKSNKSQKRDLPLTLYFQKERIFVMLQVKQVGGVRRGQEK